MSGHCEGKLPIIVKAYIHIKGKSNARITHIDLESPELEEILGHEATYCAGKVGGCFIGLKSGMLTRAESIYHNNKK